MKNVQQQQQNPYQLAQQALANAQARKQQSDL
jgi:hypothetical protein